MRICYWSSDVCSSDLDRLLQGITDDLGLPGIAAGSFLDEPLEQTDDESHARRLDDLYVAGRAQHGGRAFRRPVEAITHHFGDQADGSARHAAHKSDARPGERGRGKERCNTG